jgi:hypothetical protein
MNIKGGALGYLVRQFTITATYFPLILSPSTPLILSLSKDGRRPGQACRRANIGASCFDRLSTSSVTELRTDHTSLRLHRRASAFTRWRKPAGLLQGALTAAAILGPNGDILARRAWPLRSRKGYCGGEEVGRRRCQRGRLQTTAPRLGGGVSALFRNGPARDRLIESMPDRATSRHPSHGGHPPRHFYLGIRPPAVRVT